MLACNGRYIEITAGDDMWPIQDKLQRQTDFLEQHKEYFANCVLAEGRYTDGSLTGEIYPLDKNLWGKEFPVETLLKGIPFSDAGIMIRNVMDNATAREEFSMLPKLSRYIEDLPLDFMLYDFGKVYVTDYVGYSITHRRKSDTNQHNYNSLFNGYLQAIDHIKLINNMSVYFGTRYDFSAWLVPRLADTIIAAVKFCKPSILAQIPKIKFTCWSATFFPG